ncbi:hypothetical protein GCM10010174_07650 [Kutzneria viridogrisea]|uniref:DUF1918 domain-containing protein n=1 Tax=Kutzneria viridogrisea TaxID=47990 RepID=UPI0016021E5A
MYAGAGDMLVVESFSIGRPGKRGLILEVRGADGAPPYVVRWLESSREATVFPGPDARVVRAAGAAPRG